MTALIRGDRDSTIAEEGRVNDPYERFADLYDRCYRNVLRYALQHAEQASAEDIASETLLIAWGKLPELPEPPLAWLICWPGMQVSRWSSGQRHLSGPEVSRARLAIGEPGTRSLQREKADTARCCRTGFSIAGQQGAEPLGQRDDACVHDLQTQGGRVPGCARSTRSRP
jgi:hypothetical protein